MKIKIILTGVLLLLVGCSEERVMKEAEINKQIVEEKIEEKDGESEILKKKILKDEVLKEEDNLLLLVNKKKKISEQFVPENLKKPEVLFLNEEPIEKTKVTSETAKVIEIMFSEGKKENIALIAVSGYRSFERQEEIFNMNKELYGEEIANQTSARPGESEHQTGLAIDITSKSVNYQLIETFGETKEGKWVNENAHKYGFIIRYPKGKETITGYNYEPWHLRYVGIKTAKYIKERELTLEEFTEEQEKAW